MNVKRKSSSITHKKNKSLRPLRAVFTKKDYESNDGMLTTVWGPPMWHYLHTMSFNYPIKPSIKDKRNYRRFILDLENVLPCGKCRENLKRNFQKLPLTISRMKSRETFSRYIYELHELINDMLNKTSGLSYEQVRERYEHFRSRCTQKKKNKIFQTRSAKHKGCTQPLFGEKSKCILKIVPQTTSCETFHVDKRCIKQDLSHTQGGTPSLDNI
jgi:hypothetical protein